MQHFRRILSKNYGTAPISLSKFIAEVKPTLKPPVSNRMIYNEQLQLMVVGGPNQRKDYHINEGEEIFYQIDGAMNVDILEKGEHKTIHIPQGYLFILPSRIPHSPQRYANTIGLVVERLRKSTEYDGLRYFVPGSTKVLYEEYFQCRDLGSELVPVINRFFASECSKTNVPAPGMPVAAPPVAIDYSTSICSLPFNWDEYLSTLSAKSSANGFLVQGAVQSREYNINVAFGAYNGAIQAQRKGQSTDTLIWQYRGSSSCILLHQNKNQQDETIALKTGDIHLVNTTSEVRAVSSDKDSCIIVITNRAFD